MNYIDFHVDTLYRLFYRAEDEQGDLCQNNCQVDLARLIGSGYTGQIFACFLDLAKPPRFGTPYQDVLAMIDLFDRQLAQYGDKVRFASNYAQYEANHRQGLLSAFLSLEEGGVLDGDLSRLDTLYQRGVRVMNLTWNHENCLGFPHRPPEFQTKGLTSFGLETLERMDELGMVVDTSHLSDQGFWDVIRCGKRPFMATHSNARAIRNVSRNLTDEMIRALADRGGIMGLNFYSDFLSPEPTGRVEHMVQHLRHIINQGGEQIVGLGTDFDGMDTTPEIQHVGQISLLVRAMEKAGFTSRQIEGVCFRNGEDFFRRYWGG